MRPDPDAPPQPSTTPSQAGRRRWLRAASQGAAAAAWPALGLATPAPAKAAGATPLPIGLRIQAQAALHPVNPQLVGSNTPWVYGSEGLMDADGQWHQGMANRARELAPTVLRYPGVPDTHFWRQGLGPLAQRPAVFAYPGQPFQKIVYGSQEFLEACEAVNAQPLIQVNMHQGSEADLARQAADWVRTLNVQGLVSRHTGKRLPKVTYWELGNEPYLMETRLDNGQPNPLFLRPEQFARRASVIMAAMKAVDPSIRLGLPFALDTYSGRPWRPDGQELATVVGPHLGWADKLLAGLERPQDLAFLAVHYYMPLITGPVNAQGLPVLMGSDERLYWGAAAGSETLRRHLGLVAEFWAQHPRTARLPLPRIGVTEYNSFFTNTRVKDREIPQNAYVMTQAGALFVADLLRVMALEPRIELATQWSLNGNWVFGAIPPVPGDALPPVRPVFHAMRLFRSLLRSGQVVASQVTVASTQQAAQGVSFSAAWPGMPLAAAVATRDGDELQAIVIHKDPQRPGQVSLSLEGAGLRSATVEQVQARAVFDSPGQPEASQLVRPTVTVDAARRLVSWEMGPASFALVRLKLGA